MRPANRGDVPTPHVPPGAGKTAFAGGDEVIFDSGSLSFVKDWVEGADDAAATSALEPERSDPRPTNPNRRLGVGAKPKRPKREQPEPSALQKKLTRKRQRQELADAIVGQANTHGVAEDDDESEGESKTASFKGKKKEHRDRKNIGEDQTTLTGGQRGGVENGSASSNKIVKRKEDGDGNENDNGQDLEGEKSSRKRKARRKKREAREAGGEEDVALEESQPAAAENGRTPAEQPLIVEQDESGEKTKAREPETRKQRRGWGKKALSKPAEVVAESDARSRDEGNVAFAGAAYKGNAEERVKRKKKRSRQKNIRKDKRPLDQRPAYLRVGDPEFSGRSLTPETRKVLGLPADEIDASP